MNKKELINNLENELQELLSGYAELESIIDRIVDLKIELLELTKEGK